MTLVEKCNLQYTISMNENNKGLKGLLGILALLVVLGALWRVLSYQPGGTTQLARPATYHAPASSVGEKVLPQNETVNELLEDPTPAVRSIPTTSNGIQLPTQNIQLQNPVAYPQYRASAKQAYPAHATQGTRYVEQNFYSPDAKTPSTQPSNAMYTASNYVGPQVNFNTSASTRVQEERARMLAPYLRPNRQDKARMDAQWNKMVAALERAIAKALAPKSKKEEMIEKYAAKPEEAASVPQIPGFAGQLAPVGEQIALQKRAMMQSMGNAFGGAAAQQAGGIMDSFAGEVAAALNNPSMTAEQKEKKVQEVTKKYQDKMDKLAQKNQYDKFVTERTEQINEQKEAFQAKYDEQLSNKLGQILDEEWQQEQQLATQNLPLEEYNTKISQLHQQKRNERQQAVLEQTPNELKQMQADLKVKSADTLDKIAKDPLLGPKAAEEFKPILDTYQQQLNQLYQQELSIDERRQQESKLLKDVNRQLLDKQIDSVEKLDLPEAQKQHILDELNQAYNAI